jgi:hypothetical protein
MGPDRLRSILKGFCYIFQTLNALKQEKKNQGAQEWPNFADFTTVHVVEIADL